MKHRWITVAIALAAACAFAISVHGGRWWSAGLFEIGPGGSHSCITGECRPANLGWVGGSERWIRTGIGAWAAGLITMVLLMMLAAGIAAKRTPSLLAKSTLASLAMAAVTGTLFVVQFPGMQGASVDRGLYLFPIAIAMGVYVAIRVLRTKPTP